MCPYISGKTGTKKWADKKLIIFTEWDDTKRYIKEQIEAAIEGSEDFENRIGVYHGPTSIKNREKLKKAFNSPAADKYGTKVKCTTIPLLSPNSQTN